ncbi:glycerol-3-phosphate phosphatase [Anopheles ziemanni]|uniref:glycerol-3-phosphate phosphatase n=1 Tax=Anopheles coustani TaxID=139045 RepID=UPI0026580109|nr:glycerol-3-phosphate phosphatase [Anopheles coustani]XP_058176234.1 glycerol-3-phosphate phosphatase [Anopheles ziemanni]
MSRGRHILELSEEESRQFLASFDTAVLDCDGVLWSVYDSIEGADAALKLLQGSGKTVKFITNNSVRPFVSYRQQLQALGFAVQEGDIIHPAASIVRYLRARAFEGLIYCLGTDNFKGVLQQAGFQLLDGPTQPLPESFHQIIATVDDRAPVRAVVVDVDFNANYPKLMRAEMYLKRHPDCLLIAGAPDKTIHVKPGCDMIGPGAFVELLEKAVGKRAIVLGKPGYHLRTIVRDQYELGQPARTLLIGDMLEQDMAFASLCGFQKLLVLSGGTSKEQMLRSESPLQEADYYADSLKDFVQLYAKAYSRK